MDTTFRYIMDTVSGSIFWQYVLVGAFGAILMMLVIKRNEEIYQVQKKHRILRSKLSNVMFNLFGAFVDAIVGGTLAALLNHNLFVAFFAGFFSRFIMLFLIKWVNTADAEVAFMELIGGVFGVFGDAFKEVVRKTYLRINKTESNEKNDK